jgi:hypothetical protein
MMDAVTQIVVWLNDLADALGRWVLAPIGLAPAWFSATAVAAIAGVLMLIAFKYTSRQQAIKQVRDDISANLLTLKLFKDSTSAALQAQGRLLLAAGRLFILALAPMAVMIVPMTLFLGQLGLWYEKRPLPVGEEAVVTMQLNGPADAPFPEASLQSFDGVAPSAGPVHVRTVGPREIWWNVRASQAGYHRLVFQMGEHQVDKELAAGDGFMRVNSLRPGWSWSDALLHPSERPFGPGSVVQSIEIEYPRRDSLTGAGDSWWTCWFTGAIAAAGWLGVLVGLPAWIVYWFVASMVVGLGFSRILKVNI